MQGKRRLAQPRIHGWCHDSLVNAKEKEEEKDKAAESEDWMIQQRLHERHLQQHKSDPMWYPQVKHGQWFMTAQLSISRLSLCTFQESCLPHSLSLDLAEHFLIIMTIIINDFGPLSHENKYMYDVVRAWDPLNELYTQGKNSWDRSWVFKGITYLMLPNFNNLHESACNESHVMNQPETSEREPPPSPAPFFFFWDWMQIYTTWFDNNYIHRYCYNN